MKCYRQYRCHRTWSWIPISVAKNFRQQFTEWTLFATLGDNSVNLRGLLVPCKCYRQFQCRCQRIQCRHIPKLPACFPRTFHKLGGVVCFFLLGRLICDLWKLICYLWSVMDDLWLEMCVSWMFITVYKERFLHHDIIYLKQWTNSFLGTLLVEKMH